MGNKLAVLPRIECREVGTLSPPKAEGYRPFNKCLNPSPKAKLTREDVLWIRANGRKLGVPAIMARYGLSRTYASSVVAGDTHPQWI